jgi:1-aminocyclopropane-1-carboxylate deaminase
MLQSSHIQENSPVEIVNHPLLDEHRVSLMIKRDDLIHPQISGNKWRKLKYNLEAAQAQGYDTVLTFGGAFSNHIVATAVCASLTGFKSIGVIRGEEAYATNPTLSLATEYGMQLHFLSREDYRLKDQPHFLERLSEKFGRCFVIPEGGANALGKKGCEEIVTSLEQGFDYLAVAMGTGTTFLGMLDALRGNTMQVLGLPVIKNFNELDEHLSKHYDIRAYQLIKEYHFGGYAKFTDELITFINEFKEHTGIALDPIYTGKMMYGLFDLISSGYFPIGSKILAVHTGGLQGVKGFNQMHGDLIDE